MQTTAPKVSLGQTVMTRGIADLITSFPNLQFFISKCIHRHSMGDWGDVCKDDHAANEDSLIDGYRLLSVYRLAEDIAPVEKIWIITEGDRSITTVLLPSEY